MSYYDDRDKKWETIYTQACFGTIAAIAVIALLTKVVWPSVKYLLYN